ncbi:hypothetical protein [Pseudomonas brassicacearum]|uniref:hypothetical protein n=1 Tax=Pseudomonas brassicacearum TaxID=930166 RepID=UPI0011CD3B24|nr:hypothetical protein [Pseudomonas brassicacearum]
MTDDNTFANLNKPPPHMLVPREGGLYSIPLLTSGIPKENNFETILGVDVYPGPSKFQYTLPPLTLRYSYPVPVAPGPHYIYTRQGSGAAGEWFDTGWFYVKTPPE